MILMDHSWKNLNAQKILQESGLNIQITLFNFLLIFLLGNHSKGYQSLIL